MSSDDLEFALGLADDRIKDRRPYLYETLRRFSHGKTDGRVFLWSDGRIGAFIGQDEVRIDRSWGASCEGLRCSFGQISSLVPVVEHWVRHREEWAEWDFSFSGISASYYYQPPGARAKRQGIGSGSIMGHHRGQPNFCGKEEEKSLGSAIRLSDGVKARLMIWRSGEKQGPPEGAQVGLVYDIPGGLVARGYRSKLRIKGKRGDVVIEPRESEFIGELHAVLRSADA